MILKRIHLLPVGYSIVKYHGKSYGVTSTDYNNGKSHKVYAEELGGTDFISLNYYTLKSKSIIKPCEMPEEKVVDFLMKYEMHY
ncbi:peptide-methionine (S)-S-oxide reductase [Nonlabens dokdonensis]|jgi:peptide-methionine (S)-S-oxide reductase|uniref:Uncharacterized protein n=2 Tax=Nonlabens dokdonensis TaxID=328515 RepID=L7W1A8_NONDD|nr:hypothetical protein [Nonlabens dokdonensis]AGC75265.1 uncharacterized protein DDD_0138 [Nonlabens dokdonensis DSW-6]PZX38997.1 peptide-methionine (S)-S-oxide reductase [Nonlabens dokdonensis]